LHFANIYWKLVKIAMRFTIGLAFTVTLSLFGADLDQARQAQEELFAARFDRAAELYSGLVNSDPSWAPAYYGWVRALLGAHRASDAYKAADAAAKSRPNSAPTEAALGMAAYRRGEILESERHFRRALQLDSKNAGALLGLGQVLSLVSKFATARDLYQAAYRAAPDDPDCIVMGLANQQEGAEHVATLERVLATYDPKTDEARDLRAHIASDTAVAGRKMRFASPYQHYDIKLVNVMYNSTSKRGVGIRVEINQKRFTLLLDTGASGISISPKSARKAGLEGLGDETSEARGFGDKPPAHSFSLLAREVRIGELILADVPIAAFTSASAIGADGLIGADVFERFLVTIDFVHNQISLDPFAQPPPDQKPDSASNVDPGFTKAFRLGNDLSLLTSVNGSDNHLFLVDSGSSSNLIDRGVASETTKTYGDELTKLHGVQGAVNKVSRAQTATLVFARFRQENHDLIAFDMSKISEDMGIRLSGVLGMPVLSQLKLTINYLEGTVRLDNIKP
jgi:tetratricopeptide (TPR) repeat protein